MILESQRELESNILSDRVASLARLSEAFIGPSSLSRRDPESVRLRRRQNISPMRNRESLGKNWAFPRWQ